MTKISSSLQWWKRSLIPCTSCKTSYNVLRQFFGAGGGGSGGVGAVDIQGWEGGGIVQIRESPDFRSPEVGRYATELSSTIQNSYCLLLLLSIVYVVIHLFWPTWYNITKISLYFYQSTVNYYHIMHFSETEIMGIIGNNSCRNIDYRVILASTLLNRLG